MDVLVARICVVGRRVECELWNFARVDGKRKTDFSLQRQGWISDVADGIATEI